MPDEIISDEILIDESPITSIPSVPIPETIDPVCSMCGFPLHTLKGGTQPKLNADGTISVNDVIIQGCTNSNYNGKSCPMNGIEQSRLEVPLNLFKG